MSYLLTFRSFCAILFLFCTQLITAQTSVKLKFKNSTLYTGIEVGSKGVKMSVLEIGNNAKSNGAFNILKDSSVNTDFISFDEPGFSATLKQFASLYEAAQKEFKIPTKRIFTAISSGVKMQAEKEEKSSMIRMLIDSFRMKINDPAKEVVVVDVMQEALLSHLGIVPESRRYTTFLIDIGSGNTKGGYFPFGNTKDFYLFQLNWGTKSTANAVEKILDDNKSIANFQRQLTRVLAGAENSEIIYTVNSSGAYPLSDYIAFSGGIAWAAATLMHPELIESTVIPVTFEEFSKFNEQLYTKFTSFSEANLSKVTNDESEKALIRKTVKNIHGVFDQKSLMAGAGLMYKIMRQFSSIYETKQFYFVKNGQVGWISAYVDKTISK
ncbi:MAG TPA: hypothetical protein VI548_11120 [Chitinophagaceae bacterium]|nr:hypothetical protein [Chitinophagaceae bacterium]